MAQQDSSGSDFRPDDQHDRSFCDVGIDHRLRVARRSRGRQLRHAAGALRSPASGSAGKTLDAHPKFSGGVSIAGGKVEVTRASRIGGQRLQPGGAAKVRVARGRCGSGGSVIQSRIGSRRDTEFVQHRADSSRGNGRDIEADDRAQVRAKCPRGPQAPAMAIRFKARVLSYPKQPLTILAPMVERLSPIALGRR